MHENSLLNKDAGPARSVRAVSAMLAVISDGAVLVRFSRLVFALERRILKGSLPAVQKGNEG